MDENSGAVTTSVGIGDAVIDWNREGALAKKL